MELKLWSNPKYTGGKTKPTSYVINPGITMLIGTNGSGKTTALKQLHSLFFTGNWTVIEDNDEVRQHYNSYLYDNLYEERYTKQHWLEIGEVARIAETFENSEGQDMYDYLYYKLKDIAINITQAKEENKRGIFLLFDGLDSGLSLDVIEELRVLVNKYIGDINNNGFELYVVCTSNSYEFCNNYDCIDVRTQEHITFTNYETYKEYMLRKDRVQCLN